MLNTIQPFVNLANANLKATSHFFQAPELTELSKSNTDRLGKVAEESFTRLKESDALHQLSREMIQNYSRFTNEWMQSYFAVMTQVPHSLANQVQDFSRQIEKGVSSSVRSFERTAQNAGEEIEEGGEGQEHGKGKATKSARAA